MTFRWMVRPPTSSKQKTDAGGPENFARIFKAFVIRTSKFALPAHHKAFVIRTSKFALLAVSFFLSFNFAKALEVPAAPASWVNDYAGLLPADERAQLDAKLAEADKQGTAQIFFAIFTSLENESLEDFAIRLAEKWKAGKKGKDNGILVLLFMKERRIRIEVGYGLESRIPDALAGRIIREMAPYFRQNDYFGGLSFAADRLIAAAGGIEVSREPQSSPANPRQDSSFPWILGLLVFIFFLRAIIPRRPTSGFHLARRGLYHNSVPWWLPFMLSNIASSSGGRSSSSSDGGGFGGGWGGGGGGSGGGGSDFGGGGGGEFGGGGASGSW
jgi:uncharacterized protein